MKKNLILGVIDNYGFDQLKKFVYSIRQTSFDGDIVFFTGPSISPLTIRLLKKYRIQLEFFPGVTTLPTGNIAGARFKLPQPVNYFNYRHYLYYDFLQRNKGVYEKVLLADIRDVYFQDDPFSFEMGNALYCAIEGPRVIRDCSYNGRWMKFIYGETVLEQLGGNRISCAGSTWGREAAMNDYLVRMLQEIEKLPDAKTAIDQAIHNYLIYTNALPALEFLYNDGGVILTLSYEKNYRINDQGEVLVADDRLVKMLHQFDRYPDLKALTDRQFLSNPIWDLIVKGYFKADLTMHKLLLRAGLRRSSYERHISSGK